MSTAGDTRHTVKLDDDQWRVITDLADAERRSLTNMVGVLLDEALHNREAS